MFIPGKWCWGRDAIILWSRFTRKNFLTERNAKRELFSQPAAVTGFTGSEWEKKKQPQQCIRDEEILEWVITESRSRATNKGTKRTPRTQRPEEPNRVPRAVESPFHRTFIGCLWLCAVLQVLISHSGSRSSRKSETRQSARGRPRVQFRVIFLRCSWKASP